MRLSHGPAGWLATTLFSSALAVSCTKRNPDICCDTADQCTHAGLDPSDGLAPCADGVCVNYTCVASGCDDDLDCHDPAHPTCVSGQCSGAVEACLAGGGARIIFASTRADGPGLYSMYVNGSGQKRIADGPITTFDTILDVGIPAISVSRDGGNVAFVGVDGSGGRNVFTIGSDGSGLMQITSGSDLFAHVEWSPDGKRLAASTQLQTASLATAKTFVMNPDGGDQALLMGYFAQNYEPSWSNDGRVVFASYSADGYGIWAAADNGTAATGIDLFPGSIGLSHFYRPHWSPDGKTIAYLTDENRTGGDGDDDIVLKSVAGGDGKALTSMPYEVDLAWSHDGTKIAFVRKLPGVTIWIMDADGSNQRQLSPEGAVDRHPRWSADDSFILFDSDRDGNSEVYRMDADGANPVNLTNYPGSGDAPSNDYGAEWASCPTS